MKSSLAAMVTACERFVTNYRPAARLAFLITSDEEGQASEGTRYVMEQLTQRREKIDYCVVGEPSSSERLGDTIRIGRRGSLSCKLLVKGIRGHVAYPHLARNNQPDKLQHTEVHRENLCTQYIYQELCNKIRLILEFGPPQH